MRWEPYKNKVSNCLKVNKILFCILNRIFILNFVFSPFTKVLARARFDKHIILHTTVLYRVMLRSCLIMWEFQTRTAPRARGICKQRGFYVERFRVLIYYEKKKKTPLQRLPRSIPRGDARGPFLHANPSRIFRNVDSYMILYFTSLSFALAPFDVRQINHTTPTQLQRPSSRIKKLIIVFLYKSTP